MVRITLDEKIHVYYLWHPNTEDVFSGYGLGIDKDYIVGFLMVDRPRKAPAGYLNDIKKTFGEYELHPITTDGCRGILCQMSIEEESRKYIKNFQYPINETVLERFEPLLKYKPKPHFLMQYSHKQDLWVSEFYLAETEKRGGVNPNRNRL